MKHFRVAASVVLALSACKKTAPPAPVALTLTAGCNPLAVTSECLFPFPSNFFQVANPVSATGFSVAYPASIFGSSAAIPPVAVDVTPYNTADGVSPVTPLLMFFGASVDVSNLPDQHNIALSMAADAPIALIDMSDGTRVPYFVEMDANVNAAYPNRYAFIIRPVAPMVFSHRHAVIVTDQVQLVGGMPLPVSPAFAALRDGTITTSAVIEGARPAYDQMFTVAAADGYAKAHIVLAWNFMVASEQYVLGPIVAMRGEALAEAGANGEGYANGSLTYTVTSVAAQDTGGTLVEGNFYTPNWINSNNQFDWDENHLPIQHPGVAPPPEYTIYIPSTVPIGGTRTFTGTPIPLGIFGHGLLGTGRGYLDGTGQTPEAIRAIAEKMNIALIATDWTGLSGTADDQLVGSDVASNINDLGMVTDRLTQSLINNLVMPKFTRGALQTDPRVSSVPFIDPTKSYYYGASLGGIQGSAFVSISDEITRGVFAVPGAAWSTMFPRSYDWLQFATFTDPVYPDPLQQITLLSVMQTRWDFDDSANVTHFMFKEPFPDAPPKTVVLQESIDDCQVQNVVTEILARSIGVKQLMPSYEPVFPLETVGSGTTDSALAQYYLASDVAKYVPPDSDVAATMDNGAHWDINFTPQAQSQIINLMLNGDIVQYCDGGPCELP